jgi:hypothetical protein
VPAEYEPGSIQTSYALPGSTTVVSGVPLLDENVTIPTSTIVENPTLNIVQADTGTSGGERAGKSFTKKGKQTVIDANKAVHEGLTVCESCGVETVPAQQSQRGITPPLNETQVDHIHPRSRGGDGSPSNGQLLCRQCNLRKSNNLQ